MDKMILIKYSLTDLSPDLEITQQEMEYLNELQNPLFHAINYATEMGDLIPILTSDQILTLIILINRENKRTYSIDQYIAAIKEYTNLIKYQN